MELSIDGKICSLIFDMLCVSGGFWQSKSHIVTVCVCVRTVSDTTKSVSCIWCIVYLYFMLSLCVPRALCIAIIVQIAIVLEQCAV